MRRAINHLKKQDPTLAKIITHVGSYKIEYREPEFSTLARAIVFQQISGSAARTIYGRLESLCNGNITPEAIQQLTRGDMRSCGLSKQKIAYLRDLATHTSEGLLDFSALPAMSDEEVIAVLTDVKGIGVWSAQMFLMFALRRPNVLPVGDLGVQNAIKRHYRKRKVTPKHVEKIGKPWHPYCSVAAWYLWRSLDGSAEI